MPSLDLRALITALALALAFILLAQTRPAEAATATTTAGGFITFTASPGELNSVTVRPDPAGIVIEDINDISTSGGCRPRAPRTAFCATRLNDILRVELGDNDDLFRTFSSILTDVVGGPGGDLYLGGQVAGPSAVSFFGGEGRDMATYKFATAGVFVHKDGFNADGRAGDRDQILSDTEHIVGSRLGDVLSGDGGAETFEHLEGADLVVAGGGNDTILNEPRPDGPDRLSGGSGADTVSYASRSTPVFVTPDGQGPDDGASGERDEVVQAEIVHGGGASDRLRAIAVARDVGYTFAGGRGDDDLLGGRGPDRLNGGPGKDTMNGRDAADVLDSRDGVAERLECGEGAGDVALLDPIGPGGGIIIGPGGRDSTSGCESHPNVIVGAGPRRS
jgi:Ca2+-binding RTX toxin-like protein